MTEEKVLKCNNCGHELPPESSFCDNCGAPVGKRKKPAEEAAKEKDRRKVALVIIAAVLVIAAIVAVSVIAGKERSTPTNTDYELFEKNYAMMESRITPEMYEQLEFGMTYEEVVALFGEEGAAEYRNRYVWPGEYADYLRKEEIYYYQEPRVSLSFSDNGKLIEMREYNVLDGKEIYEAKAEERVSRVVVNDEILASMKNRMSYREIADILGAEGVLQESESDGSGDNSKTYDWEYVYSDEEQAYGRNMSITFYNDKAQRNSWDEWGKE